MKHKVILRTILVTLCILSVGGCSASPQDESNHLGSVETALPSTPNSIPPTPAQTADVDDALEQSVSDAIISHNKSNFLDGEMQEFVTEYHETLKTVVDGKTAEVYLVALYAQYQYDNGDVKLTGAASNPCVITFAVTDGTYGMTEYWEPEDGESFDSSLRSRFPEDVVEKGTEFSVDAMEICNQRAADYFKSNER